MHLSCLSILEVPKCVKIWDATSGGLAWIRILLNMSLGVSLVKGSRHVVFCLGLPISEWKWEHVTIDFITGFQRTSLNCNAIWVIMDRLTKSAYFIAIKTIDLTGRLARLLTRESMERIESTPKTHLMYIIPKQ